MLFGVRVVRGVAAAAAFAGFAAASGASEFLEMPETLRAPSAEAEVEAASWLDGGCRSCDACDCCCPHPPNCGALGKGVLTYDACHEGSRLANATLGRLFQPTERCFDDFISPITNPLLFEDPRHVTEFRALFLQHKLPIATFGGDVQVYALQIRARLNERWSLIASRDGFIVSDNPLLDDGFADVDLGVKFSVLRDPRNQRLLSAGIVYDMPVGSTRALQGLGDGEFHLFLTGGAEVACNTHWLSATGILIPVDGEENGSILYWSNHLDYEFRRGWYALVECNWFHHYDEGGDALGVTGVEGIDLISLGSSGVDGNDIVTGAFGVKYKPHRRSEIGVAWELPLSGRRDILENRINVNWIVRY